MINETCIVYEHGKGIPTHVHAKAKQVLHRYHDGELLATKHNSGRGESLWVGQHYRLYRRPTETLFTLYSHERYNREMKRRK